MVESPHYDPAKGGVERGKRGGALHSLWYGQNLQ